MVAMSATLTVVVTVARLFVMERSSSYPFTAARFTKGPPMVAERTIVTTALCDTARLGRVQTTVPAAGTQFVPAGPEAEAKLTDAGNVSVMMIPVAGAGPLLRTVTV